VYARAAKLGLQAYNDAAEVKVRAERKAGEMLAQLSHGKQNSQLGNNEFRGVIEDQDIPKTTAYRWQQIAELSDAEFEQHLTDTRGERPITTSGTLRLARENNKDPNPPALPDGKYRVIYADPPWKYGNTMPDYMGVQDDHYQLMTVKEICDLPIKNMAQDDAVLFLWVTSPILEEAFEVVRAWGFEYKSSFIWDKIKHVMGHYNSVRHEILLVCVRGSCQPDVKQLFDSVHSEERTEHSKKPEHFRQVIDTIYPDGKRIELFARSEHDNWDIWGNEIP
jgi:N6-adenosine-specific RNA methylase IME4